MLRQGVQGISDLITSPGYVNLDFADVKTVMANQGTALMGIGSATGETRTVEATKKAISSPLLEVSIDGAKNVLLNITGGPDLSLFEAQDASDIVAQAASSDVNIIFGTSINEELGDEVVVTVIATGIDDSTIQQNNGRGNRRQVNRPAQDAKGNGAKPAQDDPFGNWDLRREPKRDTPKQNGDQDADFTNVKKQEFDIFESQPEPEDEKKPDDKGDDDQPPFFKLRRQ